MANFNGNIYRNLNEEEQHNEILKVLPMLQEIMSEADYNKMRSDYHCEENKDIPFWKFVFNNVEVRYTK